MIKATLNSTTALCRPSRSRKQKRTGSVKILAVHDYQDHFFDPHYNPEAELVEEEEELQDADEGTLLTTTAACRRRRGPRGGVVTPFTKLLYSMLSQAEAEGFEHIVSWQPHGRCFLIHDPKAFVEVVMPKYFQQTKLTSFQRQVNLYGFRRLTSGRDRGAYYNQYFLRGRADLALKIRRIRIKGTGCKPASNARSEPDFYTRYHPCFEEHSAQCALVKRSNSIATATTVDSCSIVSIPTKGSSEALSPMPDTASSSSNHAKLHSFVKLAPKLPTKEAFQPLPLPPSKLLGSLEEDHPQQHLLWALQQPSGNLATSSQLQSGCIGIGSISGDHRHYHHVHHPLPSKPTFKDISPSSEEGDHSTSFPAQWENLKQRPHDSLLSIQDDVIALFATGGKFDADDDDILDNGQSGLTSMNQIDPLYFLSDEGHH